MPRNRDQIGKVTAVVAVLVATTIARADSVAPPYSYTKCSADLRYVFVMIAPEERRAGYWNDERAADIKGVRETYPRSGLYRNDGSRMPLWTVDWYAHGVEVASDGVHLVRRGPWASQMDDEAFSFFANGRLVRRYSIDELIDIPALLPRSVSHFSWMSDDRFEDVALRYSVRTKDGNSFVFDVRTGEAVLASRRARVVLWGLIAALVGVPLLVLVGWRWRRRVTKHE
jgi:hypothetical protein